MAIADVLCGVRYISYERSGCPRWSCRGRGATRRKASAVSSASRYVGLTACTWKTRSSEARMNAPATSPVRKGYSTISTLHWSSISLGYMKPSTPGISVTSLLVASKPSSHRTIQAGVKDLGVGRHVRFQDLDAMGFQELVNRVVGILQVRQLPRPGRTRLAACGGQAFRDPVIAESAFLGGLGFRIDEAATVGAGLHAIPAAEAVFLVDQNHAIRAYKGCAHRTDLRAR